MTAVLVPNRPGDTGGYQQLAAQDLEDFNINEDELDDDLLPERLKLRRLKKGKKDEKKKVKKGKVGNALLASGMSKSDADQLKFEQAAAKAEAEAEAAAAGKGVRPPPMFREVVWNEYCVLFPDGSHTPFNDEVRFTNLNGYLRKRRVVSAGGTEYALQYGAPRRGWHRHYMYLNINLLGWFEIDPEDPKGSTALQRMKLQLNLKATWPARGKEIGSVHFDSQECHLYVHRQYPNEFAVRFGQHQELLQLQAASAEDARAWMVAMASCLYFCSTAYVELMDDCARFFGAVPKSYEDGRLSVMEALDLLRAMGRETTLEQVEACAELTATGERRFDSREFAMLVRYVCSEVEPAGELLRAFETFDPRGHNAVSADALVTQLINNGAPPEEIESVIRAAGPSAHGNIHYVRLVRALYPHSGGDADELLRETGSTRGSVAESASSQRSSVLLADQKKRQSIDKEKKLRASEASELQSHRQSITLKRADSSDADFEPRAGGGPIAAAARAQLPGSAQCASAADGGEQLHRI